MSEESDFKIGIQELTEWANAIREIPTHEARTRALDALWWGQLLSKSWLVNHLGKWTPDRPVNIYIFGGWIGILANMILQSPIRVNRIRSIDIDPWCESIADRVNTLHIRDWKFKAITADMATYQYDDSLFPDVVINTSTEHVTQEVYESWVSGIPSDTLVVTQGNNLFDCIDHIRCTGTLEEFVELNVRGTLLWSGHIDANVYTRWMAIWKTQ